MSINLTLIPTTVVGSYALPGWLWTAISEIEKGNYGKTDIREAYDDAASIAVMDQERTGVDIISDGEMRRSGFIQGFYKRMEGLVEEPPLRKLGPVGHDSPTRYRTRQKLVVPEGLGIVEEFKYARSRTLRPMKATCPGPLTLTVHIRAGEGYSKRIDLAWDFSAIINKELKALVKAGADFIQIDEPSFAIMPGDLKEWVALFNSTVQGVDAKLALHICFGNISGRARGKRTYRWMFPTLLDAQVDQFVFEFASREMSEASLWHDLGIEKELGAGVVDVKSFYVETAEDVAERIRLLLKYIPPEKLYVNPDCGFFETPRWLAYSKLEALVAGTKIVRRELTGASSG